MKNHSCVSQLETQTAQRIKQLCTQMWDQFQESLVQLGIKEKKEVYPLRIGGDENDDDYGEEYGVEESGEEE